MIHETVTPALISSFAKDFYRKERSQARRLMQQFRPYICPLHRVMDFVPPGSRVLDPGCGMGLFLLALAHCGKIEQGFGFDLSLPAINAARQAAAESKVDAVVSFEQRDANRGMPSGDWTAVSSIDVLHHVPPHEQEAYVRNLCEALPGRGRLVIKDMVSRPMWRAWANNLHDLMLARQWVHHRSMEEVRGWAEGNGFTCTAVEREDTLWYGHWLIVFDRT